MTANRGLAASVLVAALGYFVDLYDIVIFGVVRVASLTDLGITGAENTSWGIDLLNLQMIGMLIGGVTCLAACTAKLPDGAPATCALWPVGSPTTRSSSCMASALALAEATCSR